MPRKLRMGVIGLGMGRAHINGYQSHPDADLVALCDVDGPRLKAAADQFGVENTYVDAAEMFKNGGLDAVSIAVPNKLHAPLTVSALKAGLHVLCEKPPAMTVKESQRMQATAEKAGKNLMINFSFRFNLGGDHFISPSVALFGKIGYNSYSVGDFGEGGLNIRSGLHFYPSCFHGQEQE